MGIYHSVQLLPPRDCLNCTFIRTREGPVVFSKSLGKTFQHFTNHGNLIGRVCISASAKLRLTKDKIGGTKLALVEVWVHFRVTNSGETIGYGIANWALVA